MRVVAARVVEMVVAAMAAATVVAAMAAVLVAATVPGCQRGVCCTERAGSAIFLVIVLRGWPRVDGPNSWESRLNVGARIMTTTALGARFTLTTFHEVGMRRLARVVHDTSSRP